MGIFEALLSTEFLAGVVMVGALAMAIRSTFHFSREAALLRPKLDELETEIRKLRDSTAEQRRVVDELAKVVEPIEKREALMRAYYEELQDLRIEYEKSVQAQSEQEEADRRRRIQRKKMGYDI